ncbi:MAG: mechanosensitive ion channel [Betaproteobacteria bacterium]|nr:mechanosensitive ion channel [Betaproteobacteria bacterium]
MRKTLLVLLMLFAVAASVAWGAEGGGPQTLHAAAAAADGGDEAPEGIPMAPVRIDGRVLFKVRGSGSFLDESRAEAIAGRIVEVARDTGIAPESLRVEERPLGSTIVAGKLVLMTVLDADARIEGIERPVLAQVNLMQIRQAITRYRSDREQPALLRSAAYASAAVVLLGVVLYVLRRLRHFVDGALERRYRARLDHLEIGGFKVLHAERLWGGLRSFVAACFWLLSLSVAYFALDFALLQFPATRGFGIDLLGLILGPLARMGKGLVGSIPNVVFLVLLVLVTRYVLKTLHLMFGAIEQGAVKLKGFDRDWTWPTYRIVRLLVVAFAVVVAFPYIPGSSSEAFTGVSLFLGIIFSLGSTSIIANIIAGYSMTYRRAFRVGDRIKVNDIVGEVTEARLQVTHVRSLKNEEVVIPNSIILNSAVVNYSTLAASKGLILHTTVGIGYETPWRQVEAMLLMAAERTPRLLEGAAALRVADRAGRLRHHLRAECLHRPARRDGADLWRNAPQHPRCLQRVRRGHHDTGLRGRSEQPKLVPQDRWYTEPARR